MYYVNISNPTPSSPYTSWETAATNIQDAIDISYSGGEIIVTNGIYILNSQLDVNKSLTIESVNGPDFTVIDGNNTGRCFRLYSHNTTIEGFKITGGNAGAGHGGAVFCDNNTPVVENCLIIGNVATDGGGTYQGTINNCAISGNTAAAGGGADGGILNNCTVTENAAGQGGGTCNSTVNNSIVYYNRYANRSKGTYNNCCTTLDAATGSGNITNLPMLITASHIATNSPCIAAGTNGYTSGVDIDGEAWKNPPAIGCDEVYVNAISGSLSVVIIAKVTNAYQNLSLQFVADIDGRLYHNIWSFGDGTSETNRYITRHSWSSSGSYDVILTAFNDTYPDGVSGSVTVHIFENGYYVDISNTNPVAPYSSWDTAATNIQNAVDAVVYPHGIIYVTNGTYILDSQINVNKHVTIRSINGPEKTIVDGKGSVRGFSLQNYNTILEGFTITNCNSGSGYGAGVHCSGIIPVISNCLVTKNKAGYYSGGVHFGTINNCTINGNTAKEGDDGDGAGTTYGIVNNCTISENSCPGYGGGCKGGTVNNSLIINNTANVGGGTSENTVNNCTIGNNHAVVFAGGTYRSEIRNSIVYYNTAEDTDPNTYEGSIVYSCTTPAQAGAGNKSSLPQFSNHSGGDFHLLFSSPCADSGHNDYIQGTTDLDGMPRILNGTVNMGCYELLRNYLLPAPTINLPVSVPDGGNGSYFTTNNQVTISGTKLSETLVGLETGLGGVITNNISQPLAGTDWQHTIPLNNGENKIVYFGCKSNIFQTSAIKTSLDVTLVNLYIDVNALIFPAENSMIFASTMTNIIWDVGKITDDIDGTNLTISKIDLHYADTTNFILEVTNNIANTLGEIEWYIPDGNWDGETNYVLKLEVVDSSSLTNSRIFWYNKFVLVPEPCYLLFIILLIPPFIKGVRGI